MALTGGAMQVAATVVAQVQAGAAVIVEVVYMASQCRCAAFAQDRNTLLFFLGASTW
jgi:hypothetical protein